MDLRKFRRASLQCPVSFSSDRLNGAGTVYNVSTEGCAIKSELPVAQETYLAMQIGLPNQPTPLAVDMAVVEWAQQSEFGVRFVTMQDGEWERLRFTLGHMERTANAAEAGPA